jgi:hypothetical protein
LKLAGIADTGRIERAFQLAFARNPSAHEKDLLTTFMERQARHYASAEAPERTLRAYSDLCQALLSANEFIYID